MADVPMHLAPAAGAVLAWYAKISRYFVDPGNTQPLQAAACPLQNTCSWSLTEFHAALVTVVRDGSDLLGAHPAYASLMERALVKAVLQHVAVLERLCHVSGPPLPRRAAPPARRNLLKAAGLDGVRPTHYMVILHSALSWLPSCLCIWILGRLLPHQPCCMHAALAVVGVVAALTHHLTALQDELPNQNKLMQPLRTLTARAHAESVDNGFRPSARSAWPAMRMRTKFFSLLF